MVAVRVLSRTSASTGTAAHLWDSTRVRPFVLRISETVESMVAGDGAAILVADPTTPWHIAPGLVGNVRSEATGTIPGEEVSKLVPDRIETLLSEPPGTPVSLSKSEAVELARRLFGSDTSLPSGAEYVDKVRGDWSLRLSPR